jgi:methionyl-tRNA formyltransferase
MNTRSQPKIVFFGTSRFAEILLQKLASEHNIIHSVIITTPDMPVGRKQIMTASPVKEWALKNSLPLLQPAKLKGSEFLEALGTDWDLFIVASYGKIIPKEVLDIPRRGTLNVHPSLLPRYRGASPLQAQILANEEHIGTTIMLMDEEVDHGAIVAQKEMPREAELSNKTFSELESFMAIESAEILAICLGPWLKSEIEPQEQNHSEATFTALLKKEDGRIDFDPIHPEINAEKNWRTYLAYEHWPGTFFFIKTNGGEKRIVIKEAELADGSFIPKRVIPEGKKEMAYDIFLTSLSK